jgi:NAD(P)-dependent dehydrogenase (short-subunit alcohol dehydrogenase family)
MVANFTGKVAIVAGAARPPGIGHRTAIRLARGGAAAIACVDAIGTTPPEWEPGAYDTGIVARSVADSVVAEVAAVSAGEVVAFEADPFDQLSWARAAQAAIERFGRVDICCALMGTTGPHAGDGNLVDLGVESLERCLDVNVVAPLLFARTCARDMVARGNGTIVLLSSYSAVMPPTGSGAIAASRSAINVLTGVLAMELGAQGIRVNAVQPLSIRSGDDRFPNPGLDRLAAGRADSFATWVSSEVPLGRPQSADETAAVVEFLCSDEASYVSGTCVPVAGGAHTHA